MTYIPTKEDLIGIGFEIEEYCEGKSWYGFTKSGSYIEYKGYKNMWKLGMRQIFPQSLDDIRTLIRLLTPQ